MTSEERLEELINWMNDRLCLLSNEQKKFISECDINNLTKSQKESIYNLYGAYQVIQATIKSNKNVIRKK